MYHYYRSPSFNTNYYFNEVNNLDKNDVIVHQYGGRLGGPIVLPGLTTAAARRSSSTTSSSSTSRSEQTRTRTMLRDSAMNGIFAWDVTSAA